MTGRKAQGPPFRPPRPGASGRAWVRGRSWRPLTVTVTGVSPVAAGAAAATVAAVWWVFARVERLEPLAVTLMCALVAALALESPVAALERRGVRRVVAATLLMGVSVGFVLTCAVLAASMLVSQSRELARQLPSVSQEVSHFAGRWLGVQVAPGDVEEFLKSADGPLAWALTFASQVSWPAAAAFGYVLTGGFCTFYLLVDGPRARAWVRGVVPVRWQGELGRGFDVAVAKAGGWLRVRFTLTVVCAGVCAVTLSLLGVPSALFLALWCAVVSQLVPVVGTYVALVVPALVALLVSPASAVVFVVVFVAYQQVENLYLAPRVSRWALQLHPVAGLLSVLAAAHMWGPAAALVASPVAAMVGAFVAAYLPQPARR